MPTEPYLFRGALTDPQASFRHLVETQRSAALSHESFLLVQLTTLQNDLASVRSVIVGCDAALASTSQVLAPDEIPASPVATIPEDPENIRLLQSQFDDLNSPPPPPPEDLGGDPQIPSFLTQNNRPDA